MGLLDEVETDWVSSLKAENTELRAQDQRHHAEAIVAYNLVRWLVVAGMGRDGSQDWVDAVATAKAALSAAPKVLWSSVGETWFSSAQDKQVVTFLTGDFEIGRTRMPTRQVKVYVVAE